MLSSHLRLGALVVTSLACYRPKLVWEGKRVWRIQLSGHDMTNTTILWRTLSNSLCQTCVAHTPVYHGPQYAPQVIDSLYRSRNSEDRHWQFKCESLIRKADISDIDPTNANNKNQDCSRNWTQAFCVAVRYSIAQQRQALKLIGKKNLCRRNVDVTLIVVAVLAI